MKNMLKNKTSLIIVCVFIGILICFFTMCNCRTNYSLIEGMTPPKKNAMEDAVNNAKANGVTVPDKAPPAPAPAPPAPATTEVIGKPKVKTTAPAAPVKDNFQAGREGFQRQRPIEYGSIQESKSDEWNLSKWVKDAMRYAKGMGNENRLDSYQYNTGPPIPLPEGELFFFKDTKFTPECCPGTYSSSLGCACLSKPQFNYLVTRGGNNTVPTGRKTAYYNEY
jgi:hypothetical protein